MISEEFISEVEDLIATYSKSPAKLQMELKKLVEKESLEDDIPVYPFGDSKILDILKDVKSGKPLDSAYIQAIDFSEDEHESTSGKIDEDLGRSGINFKKLLVEPMFISDWPVHKHEMVGHFVVPQLEADEIVEKGKISELCDPVTVSMIEKLQEDLPSVPAGLNYGELEKYFSDHPSEFMNVLRDIKNYQGPTMDEYLDLAGTVLEPSIIEGLVSEPQSLPPILRTQVEDVLGPDYALRAITDFAETDRGRAWKAIRTARKITKRADDYSDTQVQEAAKLLKELRGVEEEDSDRYPVTLSQFSEALLQTGEIEGREEYVLPQYKEVYEEFKKRGPVKIDLEHPMSYEDGVLVIMLGKSPMDDLDKIRGKLTTPGDFMRLYDFAVDQTAARNLASTLSAGEMKAFTDDDNRNSEKMEIPQGMDPTKNQNHKIRG